MRALQPSLHADSFTRDHLPPREQWPAMDAAAVPELAAYPARMNAAAELLDSWVEGGGGERPCYIIDGETWSYARLRETANRIANLLTGELGVEPGERVLLRGPNNPMFVACWFAVLKAGAVAVATMPLLRARELQYICNRAEVRYALCDVRLDAEMKKTLPGAERLARVVYYDGRGGAALDGAVARMPADFDNVATSSDDVAIIAFTSGTTGSPKGCMHFHRDIMAICDTFSRYVLQPHADDVFLGSPPIAFTFGLGALVAFPMHAGAATVLVEKATPELLLETIQRHGVSTLFTAPTMYRALLGAIEGYDISTLDKCVSAGETLPKPTFEAWERATGIRIIDGLGSTEMLHIFVSAAGDHIRPGATGVAIPGYEARVVDDDGQEVPPGTVGRLSVRGPTGCRYLDDPENQARYASGGWNYPGDAYLRDEDGYFWFQARADDMIVSAGYNISGPEVEEVLLEHRGVAECGVVASPDAERGFIVKAFVVPREGDGSEALARELQDFVKAEMAPYKYPRAIEFVAELPRTETGKLQRFRLRQRELERAAR
ncbi:MAG: AMP-binding protein [Alphaproteobacteria bacterium]|nr:AMP-binding protein [Alphaproteobacteria bacterium]